MMYKDLWSELLEEHAKLNTFTGLNRLGFSVVFFITVAVLFLWNSPLMIAQDIKHYFLLACLRLQCRWAFYCMERAEKKWRKSLRDELAKTHPPMRDSSEDR
jgi:hypothetical protein